MAENNLYFFNDHLFARKGEAAPAPKRLPSLGKRHPLGIGDAVKDDVEVDSGSKKRSLSSPMSFLIQRRVKPAQDQISSTAAAEIAAPISRRPAETIVNRLITRKPDATDLVEPHSKPERDKKSRHQLTVRLSQEDFFCVKSLVDQAGIPYQQVLEKAVRNYVLSLNGPSDRWVSQK